MTLYRLILKYEINHRSPNSHEHVYEAMGDMFSSQAQALDYYQNRKAYHEYNEDYNQKAYPKSIRREFPVIVGFEKVEVETLRSKHICDHPDCVGSKDE